MAYRYMAFFAVLVGMFVYLFGYTDDAVYVILLAIFLLLASQREGG